MTQKTFANGAWRVQLLVAVLILTGLSIYVDRRAEVEKHRRLLTLHADVLVEGVSRSLALASVVESATYRDSADVWRRWNMYEGRDVLNRYLHDALPVRHIVMFDSDGKQIHASFAAPSPPLNMADSHDFDAPFAAVRDGAAQIWFGPYVSPNSGRRSYASIRRLNDWNGAFAGLMATSMDAAHFARICKNALPGPDFRAAILTPDEQVIASCTDADPGAEPDNWRNVFTDDLRDFELRPGVTIWPESTIAVHRRPEYGGFYVVMAVNHSQAIRGWSIRRARDLSLLFALCLFGMFPWMRMKLT